MSTCFSSLCLSCALLNRLKTCKGKKLKSNACSKYIDNRAGCRRCAYVSACKSLGKKIGIYHLCGNFEKAPKGQILLEPSAFPDYKEYLQKQSTKVKESNNSSKKGKSVNVISSKRKIPLIKTKLTEEDRHKEKLTAMDNALLSSFDSSSAMLNAIMENGSDKADDWSPEGVIEKIVSSNYDPRVFSLINDGDIVKPDNPVRFMIEPNFMNISLFPRQLQIALQYFSAYCPYCSDHKFIQNVQVNTPVDEILDRTVFYSNGICPKCGSNRYEAIQKGLHGNYSTFIGLCGQRCVTGDSLILTSDGLVEIGDIAKKHQQVIGFQDYNIVKCPAVVLEDGTFVNPDKFYTSEADTVYKIYFGNGMELNCTADHPIMTQRGFVKTKDLIVNEDLTPIYINQQVWGSSTFDITKLNKEIENKYDVCLPISTIDEDIARFLGILVSKEYLSHFNCGMDTANFCDNQIERCYRKAQVTVPWVRDHLNGLLEGGVYKIDANGEINIIEENDKYIPKHIMQSPKNIVCAFLQGLFDVSGYIEDNYIKLESSSHKLLQQVSALLHNLGILCIIRGFNGRRCLKILDRKSLVKFQENINFFSAFKKVELYDAISNNSTFFKEDGKNFYYCKIRRIDKLRKKHVTYDFTVPHYHRFISNTVVSSNSGKSVSSGIFAASILAQYMSLPNPITFMKQLESVTFRMSFVGLRYQDAFENLWQDFYNNITNTPWYKNYCQFLDEEGIRLGRELYKIKDTFAIFNVKGLAVSPSGPDRRYLRGKTRIYSSLDEVCHFFGKDGSVKLDPDEVSLALDNSLYTVRSASNKLIAKYPDVPTAHSINISSPRSKLDKGMRMWKQAKHIPSFFAIRYPTWLFNPNITREDLNDRFLSDPVGAERDFGANPPFGDDLYIPNAADILGMITRKRNSLEIVKYKTAADSLGGKTLYPIIKTHPNNAPCVLACDMGYNKNSCGLALMYKKQIEIENVDEDDEELDNTEYEDDESEEEYQEIVVCCGLLEIMPKDGLPLNFPLIYEFVIKKILEDFNVQLVAFDRWQSISLRQSVYQDFGIDAVQYSVNMQDFNNLKEDVLSENFTIPKLEQDIQDIISLEKDLDVLVYNKPVSHLLVQMLTSKDNGRIITKGDETSDDLLRAVCLGYSLLFDENYSELFDDYDGDDEDDEEEGPRTDPSMSVGIGISGSGNTFGGTSGSIGAGGNNITSIPGIGVSVSLG